MSKPTVNWTSAETWERVVASIIASGVKVDLRATAKYFGTTYDTLENRFRKIKTLSKQLQAEVDRGERGEVLTPSRAKSVPSTPRKSGKKDALSAVSTGRVSKAKKGTGKKVVKDEPMDEDAAGESDNDAAAPADSLFDDLMFD